MANTRVITTFLNNQKKQPYNSLKEQQKYCKYIELTEYSKCKINRHTTE